MTGTRAIWVLGMHRSGTSLVAGALRLLGAELGPPDGILPADPEDNPRGYWEQQAVVDLNNDLLGRFGGSGSSWAPPALPAGWAELPELDDLRERARAILESFDRSAVWAVKDPRVSLTLPFWLPLVDESAAIVCLRSPRDVAASLHARDPDGPLSRRAWTGVWLEYTRAALEQSAELPGRQLFYDDWFADRARQLRALSDVLGALGSPPPGSALAAVDDFVGGELRHHASTLEEAAGDPDSEEAARELYTRLRSDATGRERPRPSLPRRRRSPSPLTSVLMAAYDPDPVGLAEAVDSVLAQSVGDLELIVVDDGSPTPVADVLAGHRDERLRIVRHRRNRGLSAARNTALERARAPLVSHLDSDDAWEPDYLRHVLPVFENPGIGLAYSNTAIVGHPEGQHVYIFDPAPHPIDRFPKIAEQNPVPLLTATARTQAVRDAGGYARWLRSTQDYHLWCRLAAAGWRFAFVDRQLARYRWPNGNGSLGSDRARGGARRAAHVDRLHAAASAARRDRRRQVRVRLRRELERLRR